jgi:hypothetical protein
MTWGRGITDAARLFADTAAAVENGADKAARQVAERTYNAGVMARTFPNTRLADWQVYYASGCVESLRPIPFGTPHPPRPKTTRTVWHHGVLVEQVGDEWVCRDVVSAVEVEADHIDGADEMVRRAT